MPEIPSKSVRPEDRRAIINVVARQLQVDPKEVTDDTEIAHLDLDTITGLVMFEADSTDFSVMGDLQSVRTVEDLIEQMFG